MSDNLLARRSWADEQIEADLKYKFGIEARVSSFSNGTSYGVMITVPNYSSAMTVQNAFSGEQTACYQVDNSWVVMLTE